VAAPKSDGRQPWRAPSSTPSVACYFTTNPLVHSLAASYGD